MQQVHLFIGSIKSIIASCVALSALFHRCLRRTFVCIMHTQTLIHATNTISSHAWQRFCPNMLLMQHTIWASTLFSTCLRRAFCLHHADSDANTSTNTISSQAWVQKDLRTTAFCPNMLLMQHTIWASTLFSTCLRRTFCLHHADSDANTCNKYNFLTGLGSKRSSHHRFCPNMLLMQHTIWASTLFSTCLRRTFCLHHADSDANTCNKYNFLTGMGSQKIFAPQILLQACCSCNMTIWASTLFSTCLRRAFFLHHADSDANTCNKYNFLTGLGSKRSSHHRFCPNMLLMQRTIWASTLFSTCLRRAFCLHHADSDANTCNKYNFLTRLAQILSKHAAHATYNLGIYPLQYMPQKSLLSAPCRFRR